METINYKIRGKLCKDWTVKELKKALKHRGEQSSGSKHVLCQRLKESYKTQLKPKSSIPKRMTHIKPVDVRDPLFRFYGSTYYQMPHSTMALAYLNKTHGLTKQTLDYYKNFGNLVKHFT